MPTYEFKCCDNQVTVLASMSEQPEVPKCGNCLKLMQRVYSFANVNFKGPGFYSNDRKETQ